MVSKRNRLGLLRSLILIVLLATGSIIAYTFHMATEVRQTISQSYIERSIDQAVKQFQLYFSPAKKNLAIAQKRGKMNGLDLKNLESLNTIFIPVLEELSHVSAIIVANSMGEEYYLTQDQGEWLTRSINNGTKDHKVLWRRWTTNGDLVEEWRENSDYDPRSRPWYKGAMASNTPDDVYVTKPYTFYTAQVPGITAAMRWQSNDKDKTHYIIAFDILLTDIMQTIADLKVSEHGKTLIINEQGAVYRLSDLSAIRGASPDEQVSLFLPIHNVQSNLIKKAVSGWGLQSHKNNQPFEFKDDGMSWWSGYHPLMTENGKLWIGVIIPQSDILGEVEQQRNSIIFISVMIVVIAIVFIVILVRKYGKQSNKSDRLMINKDDLSQSVYEAIRRGESSKVEFKSTMRMNLKTGKAGKEIEMAWLKGVVGFLNTEGGTILIGVDDNGEIVGTEADQFDNDDKCRLHFKNLINQYIGLELSKLIFCEIVSMETKKVVIIDCQVSKEPVFLKNKSDESFYIRSGPASVQLSVSKVLKYLEQRKHE